MYLRVSHFIPEYYLGVFEHVVYLKGICWSECVSEYLKVFPIISEYLGFCVFIYIFLKVRRFSQYCSTCINKCVSVSQSYLLLHLLASELTRVCLSVSV